MSSLPEPLARAYAACESLARSHYENFPVASRLLPAAMRPHVAAVYAYARVADDIADEGSQPPDERLKRLGRWQRRLHAAVAVEAASAPPHDHEDLVVVALAHSIRTLDLPLALFDDLLSAFGQDTMTTTAGDRRIRSAVWCCESPAFGMQVSIDRPTRCAPRCS